jgi:hypothetical protein
MRNWDIQGNGWRVSMYALCAWLGGELGKCDDVHRVSYWKVAKPFGAGDVRDVCAWQVPMEDECQRLLGL